MNYRVRHETSYQYSDMVGQSYNEVRLMPRDLPYQQCRFATIGTDPQAGMSSQRLDYFGNRVYFFAMSQAHQRLVLTAESEVTVCRNWMQPTQFTTSWKELTELLHESHSGEYAAAREFIMSSPLITVNPALKKFASPSFAVDRPFGAAVFDLIGRIHDQFTFDPRSTTIATPITDVLKQRSGVCQDFAQVAIGCIRAMQLPARYVSGYIETAPPPGKERLVGADASHAWLSIFTPEFGWVDFDPTNNQICADQHITVAWGRDYADVTPLKGVVFGSGTQKMSVAVDVIPLP